MNKGHRWPMARARWLTNGYAGSVANCPVWMRFEALALIYIDYILDIPVPINLYQTDCSYGQWSYKPSTGAIIWHGTWDTGFNHGDWWFEQRQQGGEYVYRSATFEATVSDITGRIVLDNEGETAHGEWGTRLEDLAYCPHLRSWEPPWTPIHQCDGIPVLYAELRAVGIDPNNLAPVSWDFTGP